MICRTVGCEKQAHPDKDGFCFRCSVAGIGFVWNGPVRGRDGWNQYTVGSYHKEHFGVESPTELARKRPDVERASS